MSFIEDFIKKVEYGSIIEVVLKPEFKARLRPPFSFRDCNPKLRIENHVAPLGDNVYETHKLLGYYRGSGSAKDLDGNPCSCVNIDLTWGSHCSIDEYQILSIRSTDSKKEYKFF